MYRASATGARPFATLLMVAAAVLVVAGCGGSNRRDAVPTFKESNIPNKMYVQNVAIDGETLPEASGGDGALTYAISPEPAGRV